MPISTRRIKSKIDVVYCIVKGELRIFTFMFYFGDIYKESM
jgi:hypothetical protein